jgi:hypothetical protein
LVFVCSQRGDHLREVAEKVDIIIVRKISPNVAKFYLIIFCCALKTKYKNLKIFAIFLSFGD